MDNDVGAIIGQQLVQRVVLVARRSMTVLALLLGMLIGKFVPIRRWFRRDRRLGLLPGAVVPTAEAARATRLRELGSAGTTRVHNCGEILFVDYDRGEMIVARDGREGA